MNFFETKFNISNIIINLLLFQSYFPNKNEVFLFNGLSWFVANIMFFYLVTPFIFHILKKFNIDKNAKILAILILVVYLIAFFISYSFKWKVEAFSIGWWLIYISPFFRIFDYLIGFLAGFIFIRIKKVKNTEREWKFGFSILEISVIGIFLLSYKSKFLLIDSLRYGVYYIPVITFVIIVFAFGKGIISKIISNKILVYLGKLSYIIYMIHQLIIYYMSMFFGNSIFYTQDMVLKNYLSNIFLFFIIICISDVINRYLIPFITRIFTTKILIKKMKIRNY
jgi:peptidoglycan/LPS O-acetylase OafA/YrhL